MGVRSSFLTDDLMLVDLPAPPKIGAPEVAAYPVFCKAVVSIAAPWRSGLEYWANIFDDLALFHNKDTVKTAGLLDVVCHTKNCRPRPVVPGIFEQTVTLAPVQSTEGFIQDHEGNIFADHTAG